VKMTAVSETFVKIFGCVFPYGVSEKRVIVAVFKFVVKSVVVKST